jgi:transposase
MLTRGEAHVDQGQQHYEEQQRQRSTAALERHAAALGFAVTPTAVPA